MKRSLSNPGPEQPSGPREKSNAREYTEALITALILAFVVRTFVVQAFKIPSGSMKPTLLIGDHILVNKLQYGIRIPFVRQPLFSFGQPRRGQVTVFIFPVDPTKDFIKRIIGLPGDELVIQDKTVYVNGVPYEVPQAVHMDPSEKPGLRDNFGPIHVPEGSYFVMGDNRDFSYDSRFWGFVKEEALRGRAFVIYGSWTFSPPALNWARTLKMIH